MVEKKKKYVCTIHLSHGFLFCICKQTEIINKIYFWLSSQLKVTGKPYRLTKLKVKLLIR